MSAKLIFFDFVTEQGTPNSPCAINASQIVYMYTTQSTKTAVVFTNGDLMVANQTLASFKSGKLIKNIGCTKSAKQQSSHIYYIKIY